MSKKGDEQPLTGAEEGALKSALVERGLHFKGGKRLDMWRIRIEVAPSTRLRQGDECSCEDVLERARAALAKKVELEDPDCVCEMICTTPDDCRCTCYPVRLIVELARV